MRGFSLKSLIAEAFNAHQGWGRQWRSPEPKPSTTSSSSAAAGTASRPPTTSPRSTASRNVAVLEKGWLGGGNTGRNTTIIRSNYLCDESAALYDHALKLWEDLSQELNYNVMYSPRGVMMLAHNVHDVQVLKRHVHANRLNGVDNEWLTPRAGQGLLPAAQHRAGHALPGARRARCSGAAAPRGMMRSPGAMRAPPTRSASTSSRTAR